MRVVAENEVAAAFSAFLVLLPSIFRHDLFIHYSHPGLVDLRNRLREVTERHRLDHVIGYPDSEGLYPVGLLQRGGEDDYRQVPGPLVSPQPGEDLEAVDLRQFQVEKDQVRPGLPIVTDADVEDIVEGPGPVCQNLDGEDGTLPFECLRGNLRVEGIILHDDNVRLSLSHLPYPFCGRVK